MKCERLVVIAGGGSPHSEKYKAVYQFIQEEATLRSVAFDLVDFVGCGHDPDPGDGLIFSSGLSRLLDRLQHSCRYGHTSVFARSFGCNLLCRALTERPDLLRRISRVVLWGPSAFHTYWALTASTQGALSQFNEDASVKGLRLAADFWAEMRPIEEDLMVLSDCPIIIARGTEDCLCTHAFADYLISLAFEKLRAKFERIEIPHARHEVLSTDPPEVTQLYLDLIFGKRC